MDTQRDSVSDSRGMMIRAGVHPSRLVILGHPVAQSLSPVFQNAALVHAGLSLRYSALDVSSHEQLPAVLQQLSREGAGGNVTMPYKQLVYALATRTTALAQRLGAVNTFWHESGELIAHNTDVAGVLASLRALLPHEVRATRCLMLGAGGAAAAALIALETLGVTDVQLWSRTSHRAAALIAATGVGARVLELAVELDDALKDATLLINATPIGMDGVSMPLSPARLSPGCVVCDLVYRADSTPLVRASRARGLRAEDGRRMLIEQGAESFRVWFDREPSVPVMWNAIGATANA